MLVLVLSRFVVGVNTAVRVVVVGLRSEVTVPLVATMSVKAKPTGASKKVKVSVAVVLTFSWLVLAVMTGVGAVVSTL